MRVSKAYPKALSIELHDCLIQGAAGQGGGVQNLEWGLIEDGTELETAFIQGMPDELKHPSLVLTIPQEEKNIEAKRLMLACTAGVPKEQPQKCLQCVRFYDQRFGCPFQE